MFLISFLIFLVSFFVPVGALRVESVVVIDEDLLVLLYHLLGNDGDDHSEQWMFDDLKVPVGLLGKLVVDFVSEGRPKICQFSVLKRNVEDDIFLQIPRPAKRSMLVETKVVPVAEWSLVHR